MGRRILLTFSFLLVNAGTIHAQDFASASNASSSQQPNMILLLADDLGYAELGCQGNTDIPTPHIDSLARDGIRFTQAYVTAPNCSPSRAGLLTGRVPMRFGYEFNPIGARNEDPQAGLPPEQLTLAEALHDVGYSTGIIGKWHLGGTAAYHPQRHGFDEFFGFLHEGHYFVPPPYKGVTTMLRRKRLPGNRLGRQQFGKLIYSTHMGHNEPDYDANNPLIRNGQPVAETTYLTEAITREAVDFIERHQDRPFFLYVPYNAVHSPLQGADHYMKKFAGIDDIHRRIFAAMLANLDDSVGTILKTLKSCNLEQTTLVVFLSDNGGPTRELTSSNKPFRGEKSSMYEGGLRVPLLMRWPTHLPRGKIEPRAVWSVDLFPTCTNLAGAALPDNLDGVDLMPFLTEGNHERIHNEFYWRQGPRTAMRVGDWKLVNMRKNASEKNWELYELAKDPGESSNVADQNPETVQRLETRWEYWNARMLTPRF